MGGGLWGVEHLQRYDALVRQLDEPSTRAYLERLGAQAELEQVRSERGRRPSHPGRSRRTFEQRSAAARSAAERSSDVSEVGARVPHARRLLGHAALEGAQRAQLEALVEPRRARLL